MHGQHVPVGFLAALPNLISRGSYIYKDRQASLEWFIDMQTVKMIQIWKWGQFVFPVYWWQKGSGEVRSYQGGYLEFKQAAEKGWWSLPKLLTANRWCPLPKWTNGIKQPWFSKKHAQTHWSCQGIRLMGIWQILLRTFTFKEREFPLEGPFHSRPYA